MESAAETATDPRERLAEIVDGWPIDRQVSFLTVLAERKTELLSMCEILNRGDSTSERLKQRIEQLAKSK